MNIQFLVRALAYCTASALGASLLAGCGGGDDSATFAGLSKPLVYEQANAPAKLSQWNMTASDGAAFSMNAELVPYDLNSTLFSDYSLKMRAIYVPPGKTIGYTATGTLDFPVGSAIVKTFYYPKATGSDAANFQPVAKDAARHQGSSIDLTKYSLVETRILVRQADGSWAGVPYVWDADQKDATLTPNGKYIPMELVQAVGANQKFTYVVPNVQTCQKCHATETNGASSTLPIGPKARNMNRTYDFGNGVVKNQLTNLDDLKLLAGYTGLAAAPSNVDWQDTNTAITLVDRAKAYLDVNCAHCHNATGNASQSGLRLTFEDIGSASRSIWGVDKRPLAYVGAGQGHEYDIDPGSAATSILLYRMSHVGAGQTMPVVGRQTNHVEAISMVGDWINQLPPTQP